MTTSATIRGWALGLAIVSAIAAGPARVSAQEGARYLWNLATETGPIRTSGAALAFDPYGNEVVVTLGDQVRIFQPNGMEDFSFSAAGVVDQLLGAAVIGEDGELALLGMKGARWTLARTSFRGELLGTIEPRGAPAGFLDAFGPVMLRVQGSHLYLADFVNLRALVIARDGTVERAVELAEVLGVPASKLGEVQLSGFGVDADGGLLLTVAVRFRAYSLSPSGELREWGAAGGAPGYFNVVSGIAADEHHYYVADALKCAVIVFDRRTLEFVEEFGYRRVQSAGGLVGPSQLAAGAGKVFVSQNANRGVAAFAAPAGQKKVAVEVSAAKAPAAGEAAPQ